MFSASVEEISDSDSQFSFSNEEESSSMHVSAVVPNETIYLCERINTPENKCTATRCVCVPGHKRGGGREHRQGR